VFAWPVKVGPFAAGYAPRGLPIARWVESDDHRPAVEFVEMLGFVHGESEVAVPVKRRCGIPRSPDRPTSMPGIWLHRLEEAHIHSLICNADVSNIVTSIWNRASTPHTYAICTYLPDDVAAAHLIASLGTVDVDDHLIGAL
jgi:hypothetical protein